jgi:hypothetical protein
LPGDSVAAGHKVFSDRADLVRDADRHAEDLGACPRGGIRGGFESVLVLTAFRHGQGERAPVRVEGPQEVPAVIGDQCYGDTN